MDSAGIAHARCDAVDGEQGAPQQFTAAVGAPIVAAAGARFTHRWLTVLVAQASEQGHLQEAERNDRAGPMMAWPRVLEGGRESLS